MDFFPQRHSKLFSRPCQILSTYMDKLNLAHYFELQGVTTSIASSLNSIWIICKMRKCRTAILRRQYYRHIFIHGWKKPSMLTKLVYSEGDVIFLFQWTQKFNYSSGSSRLCWATHFFVWGVSHVSLCSLLIHTVGRFALSNAHFARSFRMQISQTTYSHFQISQITNARNRQTGSGWLQRTSRFFSILFTYLFITLRVTAKRLLFL